MLMHSYMRYATAAYGVFQTMASKVSDGQKTAASVMNPATRAKLLLVGMSDQERKKRIAKYLKIAPTDILYFTDPGGNAEVVGHFVAVDHKTSSVVLAVRGTYSVSGVVKDLNAKSSTLMMSVRAWLALLSNFVLFPHKNNSAEAMPTRELLTPPRTFGTTLQPSRHSVRLLTATPHTDLSSPDIP